MAQSADANKDEKSPKHPAVVVNLTGLTGNQWAVLARVFTAAKRAKLPKEELDAFMQEAQAGDIQHLLQTCLDWFACQ
jgi:hypothetical protein